MSQLKVNTIRHTGGSADNLTLDNSQNVTVEGNLTVDGTLTAAQRSNRNLIINGAMQIAQRGTTYSGNSHSYKTVDRWTSAPGGDSTTQVQSQHALTSSDTGPWEKGFRHSFHVTKGAESADAADYLQLITRIEDQDVVQSGWNYTSSSSKITLSFWVKASVAQTYYVMLRTRGDESSGNIRQHSFAFALSADTWTKVTKTIPGDANIAFDNDNTRGLGVYLIPYYGTDWTTSSHTNDAWEAYNGGDQLPDMTSTWWTTNNSTFEFTGVQLEVGDTATTFEHRSYGDELLKCQRYCWKFGLVQGAYLFSGIKNSTTAARVLARFPVAMRAAPTITYNNLSCDSEVSSSYKSVSAVASTALSKDFGGKIQFTHASSSGAQGDPVTILTTDAAGYVQGEAEL